jgi:hypothetical protein
VKLLAKALIVIPILLLMGKCTFESLVVDRCFDAGGVYDHIEGICRSDITRPSNLSPRPLHERFSTWLIAGMATVVVGIALLNVFGRKVP